MHKLKNIFLLLMMICVTTISFAQTPEVEMATGMRRDGKIYIVVAVCLTILLGLFFYVFTIDRKITKLENENK